MIIQSNLLKRKAVTRMIFQCSREYAITLTRAIIIRLLAKVVIVDIGGRRPRRSTSLAHATWVSYVGGQPVRIPHDLLSTNSLARFLEELPGFSMTKTAGTSWIQHDENRRNV